MPIKAEESGSKPLSFNDVVGANYHRRRDQEVFGVVCSFSIAGCPCQKLDPDVLVVHSAQDWHRQNTADGLDRACYRRILIQGKVRPALIVQRGLRTPTGPFFARFFIGIILGLVAEFAFMVPLTRVVLSSSAAR